MTPDELAAYKAGQIDERLDNFDKHFAVVNGSIEKQAHALEELLVVVTALVTRVSLAAKVGALFLTAWVSAMTYLLLHVR